MFYPTLRAMAALVVAAGGSLAGCGLISSDVTDFDLTLPEKKFTIDTAGWDIQQSDADQFTRLSCASDAAVCSRAVASACASGCTGACNSNKTCDLMLDISLTQPVNLVAEKPELKSINDQPVIKVTIDSVTYRIATNELNVATPQLDVYVAPVSVVLADTESGATLIGSIPPIPAGQVSSDPEMLTFTSSGRTQLVNIMSSFKTPFNVLVGSSLLITAGQRVPTGKLEAAISVNAHAGI